MKGNATKCQKNAGDEKWSKLLPHECQENFTSNLLLRKWGEKSKADSCNNNRHLDNPFDNKI